MGKRLAKRDVRPDLILSSPAMRAVTTAKIRAKKRDYKLEDIVVDDRLYAGEADDLLNVIHKLGDKLERVMLFGHNPELTELTHRLSSKITHMPTCAVAEFTFVAKSWSNIGKAKPAKVALDIPKNRRPKRHLSDEGDDAHFSATLWATQREDLVVRVSTLDPATSNQVDAPELHQP